MSDRAEFDAKIEAKFTELYEAAGSPNELSEDFVKKYFAAIKSIHSGLQFKGGVPAPAPQSTTASLSQKDSGVITVDVTGENKRFKVTKLQSTVTVPGYCQIYGDGDLDGTWSYEMKQYKGLVSIKIWDPTNFANRVEFTSSSARKIVTEQGDGKWEDM
ncbi:hypothetical protein D9758_014865 [Tetrapyrgos nigripes]|uniref:Uncharacterized protein n=1 Tax=Tetrapyrgos nigripes TaxID=182062 RepID=A0A8H5FSQ2_9AGAR|nr:hypothetical protein D9758_014865 [Tetrapyrgos nigripes]